MLGNLTLNNIAADIGLLTVIIVGFSTVYIKLKDVLIQTIKEQLKPVTDAIDKVDKETTKNFLVRCIADLERGDMISETEKERFYEQYEHYLSQGGNTYIKSKVDKLIAEGRL